MWLGLSCSAQSENLEIVFCILGILRLHSNPEIAITHVCNLLSLNFACMPDSELRSSQDGTHQCLPLQEAYCDLEECVICCIDKQ